jgi:hypothetical protein
MKRHIFMMTTETFPSCSLFSKWKGCTELLLAALLFFNVICFESSLELEGGKSMPEIWFPSGFSHKFLALVIDVYLYQKLFAYNYLGYVAHSSVFLSVQSANQFLALNAIFQPTLLEQN